jgi:carbon-monoxide dehydrogenase medium subunit
MNYHNPSNFSDAARIARDASGVTRFLAGGTDVLVQMRAGAVTPDDIIDIKNIPGVDAITRTADGGFIIGAAVSGAQMGADADLVSAWPGVVEGMELVGSTQVQGRATLAGNLCNGSPAADSVPGLIAAGATAQIVSADGVRDIAIEDIPAGPGRSNLVKGEVIASITLPARGQGGGDAYLRFTPRTEMDIAVVGCAINLTIEGDVITSARVALGAVAPTVVLVPEAADAIIGTTLDDAAMAALMNVVSAVAKPISDKRGTAEFRKDVVGVLAKRVAKIAYARAKGEAV